MARRKGRGPHEKKYRFGPWLPFKETIFPNLSGFSIQRRSKKEDPERKRTKRRRRKKY